MAEPRRRAVPDHCGRVPGGAGHGRPGRPSGLPGGAGARRADGDVPGGHPQVRADRRASETQGADTGAVAADIRRRDDADSTREASPLVEAAGAVVVDTSDLTVDQAADAIEEMLG